MFEPTMIGLITCGFRVPHLASPFSSLGRASTNLVKHDVRSTSLVFLKRTSLPAHTSRGSATAFLGDGVLRLRHNRSDSGAATVRCQPLPVSQTLENKVPHPRHLFSLSRSSKSDAETIKSNRQPEGRSPMHRHGAAAFVAFFQVGRQLSLRGTVARTVDCTEDRVRNK